MYDQLNLNFQSTRMPEAGAHECGLLCSCSFYWCYYNISGICS